MRMSFSVTKIFIGKLLGVQTTYKEPTDVAVISVPLLLNISAENTDRVLLKSNTRDFIKIPIFSAILIQNKAQFLRHRPWNSYVSKYSAELDEISYAGVPAKVVGQL
jgi:hypothetical protein